jgi:uncharacterized protein YwbE
VAMFTNTLHSPAHPHPLMFTLTKLKTGRRQAGASRSDS